MAQEITATSSMFFAKGSIASNGLQKSGLRFDVTGAQYIRKTQSIGTAAEAILLGDVGTPGWCMIQNNDATNYVEIFAQVADSVPLVKLKPGEFFCGRLGCTAPAAKANTAAVVIEYIIVED